MSEPLRTIAQSLISWYGANGDKIRWDGQHEAFHEIVEMFRVSMADIAALGFPTEPQSVEVAEEVK